MAIQELIQAGAASRKARDFKAAADLYRRALEADPDHAEALRGLADAYRGLKDAVRCLETWDRYLALVPGDASVQARVGDACRRAGTLARARGHYEAALKHDANDRFALMGLGDLHQREQRLDEALACFERLLEVNPGLPHVHIVVGNLRRKKLDFAGAEPHFREALRQDPRNDHAAFGLADTLRGLGRFEEAAPYWEEILVGDPYNRQVLCRAGDCFGRLGRMEQAMALFRRALEPGYDRSALLGLARLHSLRGEGEAAARCYETILEHNAEDVRARQLLAKVRGNPSPSATA
jgi:tetratricopeptide (TPR) repeat protein